MTASVPCLRCTQPRYCSESCRSQSWSTYHQYECSGLHLLHSVGIAHLGLRIVLVASLPLLQSFKQDPNYEKAKEYKKVYNLEAHLDDLEAEDLFQYAVTAVLLGLYLEQRTKFFNASNSNNCDKINQNLENLSLKSDVEVEEAKNSQFLHICCLLLRHITQLGKFSTILIKYTNTITDVAFVFNFYKKNSMECSSPSIRFPEENNL